MALLAVLAAGCSPRPKSTATYETVPRPAQINLAPTGNYLLTAKAQIICDTSDSVMMSDAAFLADYVASATGSRPDIVSQGHGITLSASLDSQNPEEYIINVDSTGISIDGASAAGVFYGIQTLRKAMAGIKGSDVAFPYGQVIDAPAFPYRGAMLDVSRYFFGVDDVKRFIDILALHGINTFHWHLSDDQGWRIEIKSRPELVAKGSMRSETVIGHNTPEYDGKPHGGYYTQAEAREIVDYAARRHITVIPEIDMPGHMQAALAAYPGLGCTGGPYEVWKMFGVSEEVLCAGNDSTYQFLKDVIGEIIDIFPSEIIHIGGDECPKRRWKECPKCQARIKALGLKDDATSTAEMKLQSHLMAEIEKYINSCGRRIMGWDEILEGGITPGATVMSWRGTEGGLSAASMGHDVVMSPTDYCYFDYFQSPDTENEPDAIGGLVTVEDVYSFNPVPKDLPADRRHNILGAQANLWTTFISDFPLAEYMLLPRLAALAEVLWTPASRRELSDFASRLRGMQKIYDVEGYRHATHLYDVKAKITPSFDEGVINISLSTIGRQPVYYTDNGDEPTESSLPYTGPIKIDYPCTLKARGIGQGPSTHIFTEEIKFHKGALKSISLTPAPLEKYTYGGANTLIDGLVGSPTFQSGRWLGFRDCDVTATIDLSAVDTVSSVSVNTCVVKNDWVFDAASIDVALSTDGRSFTPVAHQEYPVLTAASPDGIYPHTLSFTPQPARYVRVTVASQRKPEGWHVHGTGLLFLDEIAIN